MKKFKVGDLITPLIEREAYGSNYARSPRVTFKPGMIGVVAVVDVPAVHATSTGKELSFYCVDFVVPGKHAFENEKNPPIWRCSLYDGELTPINQLPETEPLQKYVGTHSVDSFLKLLGK